MIEYNIMQLLQADDKFGMSFSINDSRVKDDAVTVYSVPGNAPSVYEGVVSQDNFQIIVKSSDFDKATEIAYDVFMKLHKMQNIHVLVEFKTKSIPVHIFFIRALHTPAELGVNDDEVMEYSLNFSAQIMRERD